MRLAGSSDRRTERDQPPLQGDARGVSRLPKTLVRRTCLKLTSYSTLKSTENVRRGPQPHARHEGREVLGLEAGAERGGRVVRVEVALPVRDLDVVGLHQPPVEELVGHGLAGRPAALRVEALDERVGDLVGAEVVVVPVELRDGVEVLDPRPVGPGDLGPDRVLEALGVAEAGGVEDAGEGRPPHLHLRLEEGPVEGRADDRVLLLLVQPVARAVAGVAVADRGVELQEAERERPRDGGGDVVPRPVVDRVGVAVLEPVRGRPRARTRPRPTRPGAGSGAGRGRAAAR